MGPLLHPEHRWSTAPSQLSACVSPALPGPTEHPGQQAFMISNSVPSPFLCKIPFLSFFFFFCYSLPPNPKRILWSLLAVEVTPCSPQ